MQSLLKRNILAFIVHEPLHVYTLRNHLLDCVCVCVCVCVCGGGCPSSNVYVLPSSSPSQYMLNSADNPNSEDVLDYGVLSESDSVSKHFFLINPNPIRVSQSTDKSSSANLFHHLQTCFQPVRDWFLNRFYLASCAFLLPVFLTCVTAFKNLSPSLFTLLT